MTGELTPNDPRTSAGYGARAIAMLSAAAVHCGLFALTGALGSVRPAAHVSSVTEIAIETIERIQREQPLPTEPEKPALRMPAAPSPPPRRARSQRPAPPAPVPAQAAAPMAAPEATAESEGSIVSSAADTLARGTTASDGASSEPAVDAQPGAATTTPSRTGAREGVDRSRAPRLAGTSEWRCAFPLEADGADVDRATVTLRVEVAPDGSVLRAAPLDDPGHGFARQAQRCAQQKRWTPGLDRAGNPARATALVRVSFVR